MANSSGADPERQGVIGHEQSGELDLATIERIERNALGYIDTADTALAMVNEYANDIITLHPEKFAGLDISDRDLITLVEFGMLVNEGVSKNAPDKELSKLIVPHRLFDKLVSSYEGLEETPAFTEVHDTENREKIDELATVPADLPAGKSELDDYVSELAIAAKNIPSVRDTNTVTALSFVRLAQFFQQERIQQGLPANSQLPSDFVNLSYVKQGAYLAGAYHIDGSMVSFKNTLRDIMADSVASAEERENIINSYTTELELADNRTHLMKKSHHNIGTAYKAVIDSALGQAVKALEELAEHMPAPYIDGFSPEETDARLGIEREAVTLYKRINRRAKSVIDIANSLRDQMVLTTPKFELPRPLPIVEPRLADHLKQLKAARTAGTIATNRAAEARKEQALRDELESLRAPYFMTRADVKKVPGSNNLTAVIIKGEVGDDESTAEALAKEDAYDAAGLLLSLDEQLSSQTRNRVFDKLFEAYENERPLMEELGEHAVKFNLTALCDWLIDNVAALQASELQVLHRVGDGLVLYGSTHRTPAGQRIERAARKISSQTLQSIEALRVETEPLDIRAFPPGISNLEALEEDTLELATRPGSKKIPTLDWARLVAMDELSVAYSEAGYDTQLFRLLPGSLKERFPYYALVINANEHTIVAAENPKTNNATYVFEELDPKLATWQEMIQLDKKGVRELGGRAMRHDPDQSLKQHFERVNDEVVLRLVASKLNNQPDS